MLRSLRFWAGLLVSVVLIGLFLRATHPRDLGAALGSANYWWLIPATAVLFGSVAVRCMRWSWLMRPVAPISPARLLPYAIIGYMANNLLPARAGEVVRAWVLGEREHVSKVSAIGTIAVERLFDGSVLVVMFLLAGTVVGIDDSRLKTIAAASSALFIAALVGFYFVTLSEDRTHRTLRVGLRFLPRKYEALAENAVVQLARSLRSVHDPKSLVAVVGLSAIAWTLEAECYAIIGRGFGLDITFAHYCLLLSAANLAIIIPTFFGGTGPFEWAAKLVLVGAGVADATASAYSIVAHAAILVPTTVIGLLLLWSFGISFGRVTHASVSEEEAHA